MKTFRITGLLLALSANVAWAQDDPLSKPPFPEVTHRIVVADDTVLELLRQGGMSIGEAGHRGVQDSFAGKCDGPDFNKKWPACNHADLQYFPVDEDCPGALAIVTGGSGACQNTGGLSVPLVEFYGDDWSSWWGGSGVKRCRTPDVYQVGEFQDDGTTGLTATSTTLWQIRPWKESGKPLPPGFDPNVAWQEAQCSGFLEIGTFGYNGGY